MSGTPRRYRLLPSHRLAACQPCHSGMRVSRLYGCPAFWWSESPFPQASHRLSAGKITRLTTLPSDRGLPREFAKIGPTIGFPERSRCISSRSANCRMTGTGARPFRVLGSVSGLPCDKVRSAPAIVVSGPLSVHSCYGLHARRVA